MTDHADILRRLEAAKGADREIDRAILRYLGFTWRGMDYWNEDRVVWKGQTCFTYSLDAAIALVERMKPGWTYLLNNDSGNMADLFPPKWPFAQNFEAEAATMPLAICLALFRALEAGK